LLAHVAWNRALGHDMRDCHEVLNALLRVRPSLWPELRSRDTEAPIAAVRQGKERFFPAHRRIVLVCGLVEGKVHMEWCEERDYPRAVQCLGKHHEA
jgi:hypothetical protein